MRSWSAHAEAPAFLSINVYELLTNITNVVLCDLWLIRIFVMRGIIFILLSLYQKTASPDHGLFAYSHYRCRFFPSCSVYSREAISRYGLLRGIAISFIRIMRCGPWSAGGYAPLSSTNNEHIMNTTNTHS